MQRERHWRGAGLTLALLTAIATVQFFDRALTVVILEPIKREFALGDAQLGVLAGLSYAAAFALAGIPLGWLADRSHRRNLLAALLAVWSAMVALAGNAGHFATLIAARIGIGAMDAGGQPCSVSMIADLYPPQRRATAVAVFYVGVPLGDGDRLHGRRPAGGALRLAACSSPPPRTGAGGTAAGRGSRTGARGQRSIGGGTSRAGTDTGGHAGLHSRAAGAARAVRGVGAGHRGLVGDDVVDRLAADPQPRAVAGRGRR